MITIYKYTLSPDILVEMPEGSQILTIAEQKNEVCMWVKVNTQKPMIHRRFVVFGTGHEIPKDVDKFLKYAGTAHGVDGSLVFHVFEVILNKG